MRFFSNLWTQRTSTLDGSRVAEILIEQGATDISEESLYALAEEIETPDADTFVESVQEDLQDNEEWEASGFWKRLLGI